jgi:chemotaxis family two-component system response regulator PixH
MSTVLMVEDALTDMEIHSRYLRKAGLEVVVAKSTQEAQEKLNQLSPDLILLDVLLPGQSGFEFCRELKSNPDTQKIPVVLCSTKGSDVDKMWGDMLGADGYLSKPLKSEELVTMVNKLIR